MGTDAPDNKSLILYAIWMTALAVVILWAAYLVRSVLLLVYISGLLAIGFSPTVRLIERQTDPPDRHEALPAMDGDSDPLSDDHRDDRGYRLSHRPADRPTSTAARD